MRKRFNYITALFFIVTLIISQPVWAAGPPSPSPFSNPLAVTFIVLMLLLLIIIGILANVLIGAADLKINKKKKASGNSPVLPVVLLIMLLCPGLSLFAQDVTGAAAAPKTAASIGGMEASSFYIMVTILFLELFVIIALLINIRLLLKIEKEKISDITVLEKIKATRLSWWDRFNKLKPVSQEAELDLGHEYDGIRELNNRLPPWWLYGFYVTILFAGIYMWRFHVSHTGPSSKEEYESSVARAELRIQEVLKKKGEAVDENTVQVMKSAEDLAAGKVIYSKSCASCHKESGAGDVGPNLTDDYWMHGNDIKSIFKTIRYGINAMPQWQNTYSNKQIAQVASYLKSLQGTNPANPKPPQGVLQKEEPAAVADSTASGNKVAMNQ